ncbi:MAG: hypothetical protein U1E29_03725 [Coriobacteriia bacterium]|nr:hypothetical protein [Coriobacteriia bacterium]
MSPEDANDIRDLGQKVLDGRTVQGGGSAKKNVAWYKRWVSESESGGSNA